MWLQQGGEMGLFLFILIIILFLFLIHTDNILASEKWKGVAAIAQVVIVLLAVFGEWMKTRLFPYRVNIHLYRPDGIPTTLTIPIPLEVPPWFRQITRPTIYYYLQVTNAYPWRMIEQCEVHLVEIQRLGINGRFMRVESFAVPIPLTWAPALPGQKDVTLKTRKLVDFLRVNFDRRCLEPIFVLGNMPNNFEGWILPGDTVRYFVELSGKGYTSERRWGFEIAFDGEWQPEMEDLREQIRLTPLQ